jgi:pilus assembly protein Flp/PilA
MLRMIVGLQTWIATARDREEGQALVEYALILALIAVVSLVALEALGTGVSTQLQAIADAIAAAGGG